MFRFLSNNTKCLCVALLGVGVFSALQPMAFAAPDRKPVARDMTLEEMASNDGSMFEKAPTLNQERKAPMQIPPSAYAKMAEFFGVTPEDPRFRRLINGERRVKTKVPDSGIDKSIKILRHVRGDDGIPLPTKDQIKLPFEFGEAEKAKLAKMHGDLEKQMLAALRQAPKLSACPTNRTQRLSTEGLRNSDQPNEVVMDMLFLSKDDIVDGMDTQEVFGQRTRVIIYDGDTPNMLAFSALSVGVNCLPFRMRATRSRRMQDEGLNALMNYDSNPNGKGKLSAKIKEMAKKYQDD